MGFVVLCEDITAVVLVLQGLVHFPRQMELMAQPQGHSHQKLPETKRGISDVGFEEPFEFQQRLLIEDNIIKLFGSDVPGLEAILNGVYRELVIVLFSCESFLLGSGDDFTVAHKRSSAVMVKSRYS